MIRWRTQKVVGYQKNGAEWKHFIRRIGLSELYQKIWAEGKHFIRRIGQIEKALSEEFGWVKKQYQKNWSEWKYFIRRIGPSENKGGSSCKVQLNRWWKEWISGCINLIWFNSFHWNIFSKYVIFFNLISWRYLSIFDVFFRMTEEEKVSLKWLFGQIN